MPIREAGPASWTVSKGSSPALNRALGRRGYPRPFATTARGAYIYGMDDLDAVDAPEQRPLGESRWPPVLAVLTFVILNLSLRIWLPSERAITAPWLLPAVEVGLLGVLVFSDPIRTDRRSKQLRRIVIALIVLLIAAAMLATGVLIAHLVNGDPQTNSGGKLLAAGSLVWSGNILAFSLLYWVFDSGGATARAHRRRPHPDFVFPQTESPELAPEGWHPVYVDYLYLGFCTSTAFSPTDVIPLTHWGKLARRPSRRRRSPSSAS
jgi:hypothetical protein